MSRSLAALLLTAVYTVPALAQDPPAHLSPQLLDDAAHWEQRARQLIDGPAACVQLGGSARYVVAMYSPGGWLGPGERTDMVIDATFEGTLDHGTWTALSVNWAASDARDQLELDRIHPIVGRIPKELVEQTSTQADGSVSISLDGSGTDVALAGSGDEALGLLDDIINDIDPAVTTSYSRWVPERRAVELVQLVPLDGRQGEVEVRVDFPEGGDPLSLDAVFPKRVRMSEGLVRVTILDAQLHLRGTQSSLGLLPAEEGASLVLGVLGFTVGIDQRIRYERARGCPVQGR